MVLVNLQANITIKCKLVLDKDDAVEYFKNHKRLTPVRFGYDTEYAQVLEYGCGPLSKFQPAYQNGDYSIESITKALDQWARLKLRISNKSEREAFVERLVKRMWEKGLYPHPFYRPALLWLEENMQQQFDEGKSLFYIADEALRIANKNIMDQNLPYTGQLQQSAFIDTIPWGETGDPKDRMDWVDPTEKTRLEREAGWSSNRGRKR